MRFYKIETTSAIFTVSCSALSRKPMSMPALLNLKQQLRHNFYGRASKIGPGGEGAQKPRIAQHLGKLRYHACLPQEAQPSGCS